MKLFILLVGIASSIAAPQEGMPSFKVTGYSRTNVPEMSVTFENGETHAMVLEPYSESPCNFIGQLENQPSSVAVTGCMTNPGDKMHITLLSDLNTKSAMYSMDFDGHVTAHENPFKYQKGPSGIHAPTVRNMGKHKDQMGDEEEDMMMELKADKAQTSSAVSWPSKLYAYVKFGYEKTMKAQMDKEGRTFANYVDEVMTHVQTYYRHYTLPTKIEFKYDNSETIFQNVYWPSTDNLEKAAEVGQADADPKVDLYTWFGKDSAYYGEVGLAYVGGCCNDFIKTSFNEWRKTPVETAMVVAHEMGHNFGMSHDFDEKHGGDNSACNGQGIMSYGDAPAKWSSCSVSDFTGYYESNEWGDKCLSSWAAYCGDACPGGACTLSVDDICQNPKPYGGCNGRYKDYFDQFCKKTCGLC